MDLTEQLSEEAGEDTEPAHTWTDLLLVDISYEVEDAGRRTDMPVFRLRCRDADGQAHSLEIEAFRPTFLISATEFAADITGVCNDRRVLGVEVDCSASQFYDLLDISEQMSPEYVAQQFSERVEAEVVHRDDVRTTIEGEPLVRIVAREPSDVGSPRNASTDALRESFEETWEADVPFVRRFLITSEIYRGLRARDDRLERGDRLVYENWAGESDGTPNQHVEPTDAPEIRPRMCIFDIEVATKGGGVPDPVRAQNPITAITGYDSYTDEYHVWGLEHDVWSDDHTIEDDVEERVEADYGTSVDSVTLFEAESDMLDDFCSWVDDIDADIITGWNSDMFDLPYIIQRSYNVSALSILDWSSMGSPGVWAEDYGGEQEANYSLQDRCTLDMYHAYSKTLFRELDSYKLENVAQIELGAGKEDIPPDKLDETWANEPVKFFAYNWRDVQAVVEIERVAGDGLIDLYENLRSVTGALYSTCNNNGPMLDTLFLRRAYEKGLALPTNTEPEEGAYHGAKVFNTVPGVHKNCLYPDITSIYPSLFAMLNLGSETIIGDREAFEASEYTEDDVFRFPVDWREFAVVPKGESYVAAHEEPDRRLGPDEHFVDVEQYKGVKAPTGSVREMFDPRYDDAFVLKPEVKESFIRSTIDEMIDLKNLYSGSMYAAVKRVTNSTYGVAGDSDSAGGKGFRLFDVRVAEGITLAGRQVITHTAETFTEYMQVYDEDATVVGGDSVPEDEPVLIRDEHGDIDIVTIQNLEGRENDVEVWSDEGFTEVKDVIKKPNRKDTYITQTKSGVVRTTEDHGLLDIDSTEVRPPDVSKKDELLHYDVENVDVENTSFTTARAWLLGLFAAEGSCGVYESDPAAKASWAINNQDRDLLKKAKRVLEEHWNLESRVTETMTSSNTLKLQLVGNGKVEGPVLGFREILYDGLQKKVPTCILNADCEAMRAFLVGYHEGDGHNEMKDGSLKAPNKDFDQMDTKHQELAAGIVFLLRQLGYKVTVDHRTRKKNNGESETYYRTRVVQWHQGSNTEVRSIEEYDETCDYVYDLETENNHFQAGVGSIIVHNTDSAVTSVPNAPDFETALEWAHEGIDHVEDSFEDFAEEKYWLGPDDDNRLAVDLESLASSLFFVRDEDAENPDEQGTQKRYGQHLIWDEDDGWLDLPDPDETEYDVISDPEDRSALKQTSEVTYETYESGVLSDSEPTANVSITGFEYVRSDSAPVTRDAQQRVLTDIMLAEDVRGRVEPYLQDLVESIEQGGVDMTKLARPKGVGQPLDDYGWRDVEDMADDDVTPAIEEAGGQYYQTPGPTYRGAKYATEHFDWEHIDPGTKPRKIPIKQVRGDKYPAAYTYDGFPQDDRPDSPEVGDTVDAVAVEDPERLPPQFVVDYEDIIESELRDPLEQILLTVGLEWEDVLAEGSQSNIDAWL